MMGVRWLLIVTTAFLLYLSGADSNANKGQQDYVPAIDNRRDVRSAGSETILGDNQNKRKNLEIKNGKQSKGKKKNKGPTKNKGQKKNIGQTKNIGQKKNRGQKKNKGQKKKRKAKKKLTKRKVEQKRKRKKKKKDYKRQQGKINKKLKLKKIKQKRQKKKKKTASRQSVCGPPVSSTCLETAMLVLAFESNQVGNYLKQSKQLIRHSATTEKKQGKKGEFEEAAFHMLMAVGGNITNPICGANSTNRKKQQRELDLHMENYDKLMNCSAAILEACTVPSKVYNATALEKIKVCTATMEIFRTFTKTCMTEEIRNDATLQCACWAEGKTKMDAIKALKCSIDKDKKIITQNKRACVAVFSACKKMEDESVNLIDTCMHDHSMKLINQTAESLHSGAMKDTGKALGDADDQAKQIMAEEADLGKQLDLDYGG